MIERKTLTVIEVYGTETHELRSSGGVRSRQSYYTFTRAKAAIELAGLFCALCPDAPIPCEIAQLLDDVGVTTTAGDQAVAKLIC